MRDGWSIKDAGNVLNIHPNKIPQALEPAMRKVATLMLADPCRTWRELMRAMDAVRDAQEQERMSPDEWDRRRLIQTGQLPRSAVHRGQESHQNPSGRAGSTR